MEANFDEDPFEETNVEISNNAFGFDDDFADDGNGGREDAFAQAGEARAAESPFQSGQERRKPLDGDLEVPVSMEYQKNADFEGIKPSRPASLEALEEREADPLRAFESLWSVKLAEKDTMFSQQRQRIKDSAHLEMTKFVDERQSSIDEKRKSNRIEERSFIERLKDTEQSTNPWEKIASLIDLSSEVEADVMRFRNLLIQLKSAPGNVISS